MNRKEEKIFKYLMAQYSKQWHQNKPYRESYDENLAVYLGETAQEKFPLSYNESFNRILPIIYTMLSRFMSQMYQTDDIVSVKPRKRSDIENAKAVEAVLNYQMDNLNAIDTRGGSYLVMMKWFFNALTFGKGIVKCYWKKEERITPRRVSVPRAVFDDNGQMVGTEMQDILTQDNQIVYNAPYVEVLNNKTFIPDIEYKSIQDMPFVFLVYNRSVDELHKLQEKGIYKNIKDPENFAEIGVELKLVGFKKNGELTKPSLKKLTSDFDKIKRVGNRNKYIIIMGLHGNKRIDLDKFNDYLYESIDNRKFRKFELNAIDYKSFKTNGYNEKDYYSTGSNYSDDFTSRSRR